MTKFHELGLAKPVARAVADLGYDAPSSIQAQMIPHVMNGEDAIGIAQTGTGKTAAFLLPLLSFLSKMKHRPEKGQCDCLILTPTRELANQIIENARAYGKHLKFSACLIVGGTRYEGQLRSLAKGVNLIVATPGRLMDHMETGAADLSTTSFVVLDEADQMLDMGFVPAVRKILQEVPDARQTLMTSATMPGPVEKLASEFMQSPQRIAVSRQSEPAKNVTQQLHFIDKPQKPKALVAVLKQQEWDKVIIFTRTKRGADKAQINLIKAGFFAQSLHGDKSFGQRRHILEEFKSGDTDILVATDLAGRGLDIDDISLVVNYDMPNVAESYVHRIGRTGRAGRKGVAVSLIDRSEKSYLKEIEKLIGMNLREKATKLSVEGVKLIADQEGGEHRSRKFEGGAPDKRSQKGKKTRSQPASFDRDKPEAGQERPRKQKQFDKKQFDKKDRRPSKRRSDDWQSKEWQSDSWQPDEAFPQRGADSSYREEPKGRNRNRPPKHMRGKSEGRKEGGFADTSPRGDKPKRSHGPKRGGKPFHGEKSFKSGKPSRGEGGQNFEPRKRPARQGDAPDRKAGGSAGLKRKASGPQKARRQAASPNAAKKRSKSARRSA